MTRLALIEASDDRRSEDVRALVEDARLEEAHASARYEIRLGNLPVGELVSTVSGGQRDDQLAYVLQGRITRPQPVTLQGFVLADWQRRPARFVLEATMDGVRQRVEGGLQPRGDGGVLFEARHVPPDGTAGRSASWVLPEAPVLAPGPLPVPDVNALVPDGASRDGWTESPLTGAPEHWTLDAGVPATFVLAGRERPALRHVLTWGDQRVELVAEPTGFPLRLDLPLGLSVVLVDEKR